MEQNVRKCCKNVKQIDIFRQEYECAEISHEASF